MNKNNVSLTMKEKEAFINSQIKIRKKYIKLLKQIIKIEGDKDRKRYFIGLIKKTEGEIKLFRVIIKAKKDKIF